MRRGLLGPLIKLIAFLVITSMLTFSLAATIANKAGGDTVSYRAQFDDVTGLNVGDDVRVAGVRVGTVSSIKNVKTKVCTGPDHDEDRWVAEVKFSVSKSRSIPDSSTVRLRWRNLVGTRILTVEEGAGDPNKVVEKGGLIPFKTRENDECVQHTFKAVDLTALFNGFSPLLQSLDAGQINQLSSSLIKALSGEGDEVGTLMTQLGELTNSLADRDQVIGSVVDNLNLVLQVLGDHDTQVRDLIDSLQQFISGLAADRKAIGDGIESVNALADVTSDLLKDIRPDLKTDVVELTKLLNVLNDNSDVVDEVLQRTPAKFAALIRTASFGSWFNFYLCQLEGTLTIPGLGSRPINFNENQVPRCA